MRRPPAAGSSKRRLKRSPRRHQDCRAQSIDRRNVGSQVVDVVFCARDRSRKAETAKRARFTRARAASGSLREAPFRDEEIQNLRLTAWSSRDPPHLRRACGSSWRRSPSMERDLGSQREGREGRRALLQQLPDFPHHAAVAETNGPLQQRLANGGYEHSVEHQTVEHRLAFGFAPYGRQV